MLENIQKEIKGSMALRWPLWCIALLYAVELFMRYY